MAPALGPVVVEPHSAHWLDAHDGAQQGADKRDQGVEDGDCAGDDPGDYCYAEGAGEPGYPVRGGVAAEMARVAEGVDEDEFCRDLVQQASVRGCFISVHFFDLHV